MQCIFQKTGKTTGKKKQVKETGKTGKKKKQVKQVRKSIKRFPLYSPGGQ